MSAECPGCWPTPKLPITRVAVEPPALPDDYIDDSLEHDDA